MKPLKVFILLAICAAIASVPFVADERLFVSIGVPSIENVEAADCLDPQKTARTMELFEEVLERYPRDVLRKAGIRRVYICEALTCYVTQVRGASVYVGGETFIYLNTSYSGDAVRFRRAIHHELLHAIEFAHPVDEAAWRAIAPGWQYLSETAVPGSLIRYAPGEVPQEGGFVSDYSRFSMTEDRAELFAALMEPLVFTQSEAARLSSDAVLAKKIEFLREYLKEVFNMDVLDGRDLVRSHG